MNIIEHKIPAAGEQVTVTFLPGHPLERQLSGRAFDLYGALVIQPADYQSDQFLTVVLSDGSVNCNLRIDSID